MSKFVHGVPATFRCNRRSPTGNSWGFIFILICFAKTFVAVVGRSWNASSPKKMFKINSLSFAKSRCLRNSEEPHYKGQDFQWLLHIIQNLEMLDFVYR